LVGGKEPSLKPSLASAANVQEGLSRFKRGGGENRERERERERARGLRLREMD
jgi:hypothetical protein